VTEETHFERQERERREYDLWLRSLQPGQGAVINHGHGNDYWLATVERRTATQIIVKSSTGREMRFRRDDGKEVGGGGRWTSAPQLVPMTPRIRDEMDLRRLRSWLDGIAYHNAKVKPTLAQLKAMKKAFDRVTHEENINEALDKGVVIQ
jgi:hypothetical protein